MDTVLDVSFAAGWFLADETTSENREVLTAYDHGLIEFAVPHLWAYEMPNALLMAHRRKRLDLQQYTVAKQAFAAMKFVHYDQTDSLCRRRIFSFAEDFGLTAYDAAYLELADRLQWPLLTNDRDLKEAAKKRNLPTSLKFSK
jgi:predicted nucleic acid-binding protein